jgi:DNA polymerase-1
MKVEQLDVLPDFVSAFGFASAKDAGYEADDFVAAAVAREEKLGGTTIVASGDRDMFQLVRSTRRSYNPCAAARWRVSARKK